MEKWMCLGAMGVAALVLLAFLLDLIVKIPFGGLSPMVSILAVISSAIVFYLGWESFREQR